jgi:hypothetical protein
LNFHEDLIEEGSLRDHETPLRKQIADSSGQSGGR